MRLLTRPQAAATAIVPTRETMDVRSPKRSPPARSTRTAGPAISNYDAKRVTTRSRATPKRRAGKRRNGNESTRPIGSITS